MRIKKVRGHNRIHKLIDKWRLYNLSNDLTHYLLSNQYDYIKLRIHPWSGATYGNSSMLSEPKGKTKQKILIGLLDIYDNWKMQLEKIGQPYYLKIWLCDPKVSESQVVCGIGERIERYENMFFKPDKDKKIKTANYGSLKQRLEKYNWDYHFEENHFDNNEIGEPEYYRSIEDYEESKKWFEKLLKKPHRTTILTTPIDNVTEYYSFKKGEVWLGEK